MTTAAVITAKLVMDAGQFQKGTANAGKSVDTLRAKLKRIDADIRAHTELMGKMGQKISQVGQKMSKFITIPILGFFALLIKRAMDADTALGKLANESMGRLNESLAKLGEKFLPLFIKFVDWLTIMIDKFLAAPPAMQSFITMMGVLLAMAGPLISLIGTLMGLVTNLGAAGITLGGVSTAITGTVVPALGALAASAGAVLAPLLLIIATVALVYLAFKTDFGGIATTAKQLWYILGYGVAQIVTKFKGLGTTIQQIWGIVKASFSGWGMMIDWVVAKVQNLMRALANIKLPKALTPGSPTPFEMGLRGISKAMDGLSRQSVPQLNASLAPAGIAQAGGGGRNTYIDNRRFGAGMDSASLRVAIDSKFAAVAGGL